MTESINFNHLKFRGWNLKDNNYSTEIYTNYDHESGRWYHRWVDGSQSRNFKNFFELDNTRQNGVFSVYQCLNCSEKQRGSEVYSDFNIYCDPFIDKYMPAHPEWVEGFINPLFREGSYAENFGASKDNPMRNHIMQNEFVIFDGKPNFYISYMDLVDMNKENTSLDNDWESSDNDAYYNKVLRKYKISHELEDWYIKQRPHHCARTLGELFKLIIDWDLAYHHFDNREKIAVLCHNVMGSINMPVEVYNEIVQKMPPSVVVKYIKGDPAPLDLGDRPKTPDLVIEWFKNKYWDLRYTYNDSIHNTEDVIENHTYTKVFIF